MEIVDANPGGTLRTGDVRAGSSVGITPRRAVTALFRFHAAGGARVASRNAIVTVCAILVVLGSAPDPLILLRRLALGVASSGAGSGPLIGLVVIAAALAREAIPRLTLGLGGWARALPADGVQHRRAVTAGLLIVQVPLAAAVLLAAALTVALYRAPLSWPKLLGSPLALLAAGAALVPSRRWLIAGPAFVLAAWLACTGEWVMLVASVALFIAADMTAGALRLSPPRPAVPAPAAPGTLRMYRFTWRAVGWRLLAALPLPALALAAAWFYTRNNVLAAGDHGFVTRLWSIIAVALYVGGVGDTVAARRPAWPWARSLPWSSMDRTIDDAMAIAIPSVVVALASSVVDPRATVFALASLPPLAALAAGALHGARRRLTRVSGPLFVAGVTLATVTAYVPWAVGVALLATPLLLRAAARRDQREVVTQWKELYHDAAGDSLAWSAR